MSLFPFGMPWSTSRRSVGSSSDADDLKRVEALLRDIRSWLDAVEAKDAIDEVTKLQKRELKEWAYDAEDLLDEWEFEHLRASVEARQAPSAGRKNKRDPVTDLLADPSFRRRVNELKQRRAEVGEYSRHLRLGKGQGLRRHHRDVEPPPSSSLLGERYIDGRDDDMEMLAEFLKKGVMGDSLTVVPIVGAPGVGKKTFVRHIYNDPEVSKHFVLRGWVTASRGKQMMELMNAIGESFTEGPCNYSQLGILQDFLKRLTDRQRFLLVLVNVWDETLGQWEMLQATFRGCACGSVIILTTQDERVANKTRTVECNFFMESLSSDVCWSVFQKHAFGRSPANAPLEKIGRRIAEECQGSPLVAKALGMRLSYEHDVETWEEFLQRDMWDEVVPELRSGYHHLPAHLKRCFVYCSMFPRRYRFKKEELVRLWMAQGFIQEEGRRILEDVGRKYFDDLLSWSFFQESQAEKEVFVMPNLLHALAQSISDGECFTIEDSNLCALSRNDDLQKARHLSLTPINSEFTTKSLSSATHLRSFLVVQTSPLKNIVNINLSEDAFCSLNCLRVLDVSNTNIVALPKTIGNLKHLRYLNLSGTEIRNIPENVFKLYNLQTLDLSRTNIRELPDLFGNLELLCFLSLRRTRIEWLPESVCKLHNLQTLDLGYTEIKGSQTVDQKESGRGNDRLSYAIGNLSKLRWLGLNATKIRKLPESIGKLSKLQTLHLGSTEIEELPETIDKLKGLRFLCLNICKIQKLPGSIHELSDLQALELEGAEVDTLFEDLSDSQSQDIEDEKSNNHAISIDRDSKEQLNEHSDQIILNQDVCDMPDSNINILTSRSLNCVNVQGSSSNVAVKEEDVLGNLQPHTNLRKLSLRFYGGARFPMWMGESSFIKLTYVILKNCMRCKTLPQLGRLPLLKELDIDGMSVEHVGQDFCGHGDKEGFASLEKLSFQNMCRWKEWDGVEESDFPHLDELIFFNCPKLKGVPCFHSSLTKLKVERCAVNTIPASEALQELQLCACDNLSELPSLNSLHNLTLMYCQNLRSLPSVPLLEKLWVEECEQLLPCDISLPSKLEIRELSSTTFLAMPRAAAC